jgi:endonuclease-8
MPEGDTIFRAAQIAASRARGHTRHAFETAYAHLDRVNVDTPIAGRTIEKCESAGKHC